MMALTHSLPQPKQHEIANAFRDDQRDAVTGDHPFPRVFFGIIFSNATISTPKSSSAKGGVFSRRRFGTRLSARPIRSAPKTA